jgi:hypothetical protein
LIFGPGEAKLELKERLSRSKTFFESTVDIETAEKLTDFPWLPRWSARASSR